MPIRVLHVAGRLAGGGAERQLTLLWERLPASVEARAFVLGEGGAWAARAERAVEARFARHRLPPLRALELDRMVRDFRPHVLHCWHTYTYVYALGLRPRLRIPAAVSLRGDVTVDTTTGRPRLRWIYRGLGAMDLWISNSEHNVAALRARGIAPRAVRIVANGVEAPGFRAEPSRDGTLRVVGVGSLIPLKRWDRLVEACGRLRAAGRAVELRIFGDGPERARLEAMARARAIDPARCLPGFVADAAERYARADVLVHPSRSEGMPNAVLEALAAGVPVLAADLPVIRDLARDSGGVALLPGEDEAALADALAALADDGERRRAMADRGRAWAADALDPDAMARAYAAIYEELATPKP